MKLSENAAKVLKARYLLKDEEGNVVETPEQMFRRICHTVAGVEQNYGNEAQEWEERFYALLSSLKFLPNSPTLMNAGKPTGQLAACFVLPVEDSMPGIFDTLKSAALILQSGGGTGFSFSRLRPKADLVRSTGGLASGPVSFMKIYNTATDVIKQGGARRGANMGILRVDHPDIMEFIRVKRELHELSNFNISVAITDHFMDAVRHDQYYDLINPHSGKVLGRLRAREVFDEIVASAWHTGDPGVVFIDRINRANPTPKLGSFESTNPCGEQPLLPFEACVLGSIDLSKYVVNGDLDFPALREDVRTAVRFLDDTIDANHYPLPEVEQMHKGNRKIGLGVMGWADLLVLMGLPYDHPDAFNLARRMMKFIRDTSREASAQLAEERGPFPNIIGSIYDAPGMPQVRNATTTTIAPTGTLATIADCSSGIEPIFAVAYRRYVLDTELTEVNRHFLEIAAQRGFYTDQLVKEVIRRGSVRGVLGVPEEIQHLFKSALEIAAPHHIEMQAAFQEFTDNAVSKTINFPTAATRDEIARAFLLAYQKGVKGITVFRYGGKKGTMEKFSDTD